MAIIVIRHADTQESSDAQQRCAADENFVTAGRTSVSPHQLAQRDRTKQDRRR
jgi:hypothetical protein